MRSYAALLIAICALSHSTSVSANVKLHLTDNLKLPASYAGDVVTGARTYEYDANVGEKNAIMDTFVFVVGETSLVQVIDTSDHTTAQSAIVDVFNIGAPGTDVSTCVAGPERLLAVSTVGLGGKQDVGRVLLFTVGFSGKLTHKRTLLTADGRLPDQIKWTKDCRTLLAAIEGEAGTVPAGQDGSPPSLDNPLGGIAVLHFRPASDGNIADDSDAAFTFYSFEAYVSDQTRVDDMLAEGVRWSLRPDTKDIYDGGENDVGAVIADDMATLARDLEPEYLALSSDGKTVYVGLQEACAIATFDLETNTFTQIKALQPKEWWKTSQGLDASNKDDRINMRKWHIYGMLMPDTIMAYTASDGEEYIVTANEGDDKEYEWETADGSSTVWTEMIRGKDIADMGGSVKESAVVTDADLADETQLGRIKIGWFDGRSNFADKQYDSIYTMGGRSFSIISTKTWETVYDSGSLMEEVLKEKYPSIFNSEAEDDGSKPQTDNKDDRSDDKGLEVEALTIATVCDQTFLFVGAERTSTIFVFDITDPRAPKLESHINAAGDFNAAHADIFALSPEPRPNTKLGQVDPEMMSFDAERHLLIVSGAVTGTLGIYQVTGLPTCKPPVALKLTDNLKLPASYAGDVVTGARTYEYDANVGEKNAIMDTFVFVVGETSLVQVIDTSDHTTAQSAIVDVFNIGAPGTDVSTCVAGPERLLAVSTVGLGGKQDVGRVLLFTVGFSGKLTHKRTLLTADGRLPDQIKWTKDCRTLLAAIEGEAGTVPAGQDGSPPSLDNPLGGIAVLHFRPASDGNIADDSDAAFTFYSFEAYVSDQTRVDDMLAEGVRWSLRPDTKDIYDGGENDVGAVIPDDMATLARDLEPEYLALSSDGKTVYVGLQEACAIATFDLETNTFTQIKALQPKEWWKTSQGLDASNKDDRINMQKWHIYGMLMPDTIMAYTASDGEEYIVTANEGDDKEYEWETADGSSTVWTEMIRGKDIADMGGSVKESAVVTDADLADETQLGRIKIGWFDGRSNFADKQYDSIYTMGGRSFSIISTKTWETVYDSGSLMEEVLKEKYPSIFNSEAEDDGSKPQTDNKDDRSDDKGLEVEALTIATVCDQTFLFVGAERTSTIFVFDITDPRAPKLESHINAAGDFNAAHADIFALSPEPRPNTKLGQVDPEMMSFDAERHLLIVSGAVTGTLGIYQVTGLPICEKPIPNWGHVKYSHCSQPFSWQQLVEGEMRGTIPFETGGLGKMMEVGGYEVWLCLENHPCGDPYFCFVYHEGHDVFTPWAENSILKLV